MRTRTLIFHRYFVFILFSGIGQTINLFHSIGIHKDLGVLDLQGEVTFADMHIGYQQRIRDWLAAYVQVGFAARLGTEIQSVLTQGFNTVSTFEIGWHIRLFKGEKYAITATAELQNHDGIFINDHPDPQIKERIPVLTVGSGLRFAYGFSDLIGMSASADFAYTKASNFSLGIEYSLMVVPMPKVEKAPMVYTLALSSRFYF